MYFFHNRLLLLIIPIFCMIADWAENYFELFMLKTYLNSGLVSERLVSIGSEINSFKLILSSITFLVILIGIILKLKTVLAKPRLH